MSGKNWGVADYRGILDVVSDGQRRYVEAFVKAKGDREKAAKALGCSREKLRHNLKNARRSAARAGKAIPDGLDRPVPEGFAIKRVSTYHKADTANGKPAEWVIKEPQKEARYQALLEAFRAEAEQFRGIVPKVKKPKAKDLSSKLLAVYPMGDPHLGMFSWHEETGENFDLKIAERELFTFVDMLVDKAPPAKNALIISLGDFFHAHDDTNRTKASGHALDIDGRAPKVFRTGVAVMKRIITRALEKHEHVTFISEVGNHDDQLAMFLGMMIDEAFHDNPRVTVDLSPQRFHWYRFGKCLIGTHHGHTARKPEAMRDVMTVDRAKDWGETLYRRMYVGHVHHTRMIELAGVIVEYFRNTAPNDAWHHDAGYRSQKDMRVDIWHEDNGLIGSWTVPRELVKEVA